MFYRIFLAALTVVCSFVIFQDLISTPTCEFVAHHTLSSSSGETHPTVGDSSNNLKVMMVADLLLLGSDSGFVDRYFTEYYMSKFFKKSFERLMPDMLIVLGDVSAKGYRMGKLGWNAVLSQFQEVIGPFFEFPFHVVLGDRDVGDCSRLDRESVDWVASRFPGLDSAGSGGFIIGNVSFLSLNAVALLCGNNDILFSTEKRIERERSDIWMENEGAEDATAADEAGYDFKWRGNKMSSGSGPVVLLHFPLHYTAESCVKRSDFIGQYIVKEKMLKTLEGRDIAGTVPYDSLHHLPANASEYIFQALKPRDNPGFIMANFKNNGATITISQCFLARESHILAAIASSLILFSTLALFTNKPYLEMVP